MSIKRTKFFISAFALTLIGTALNGSPAASKETTVDGYRLYQKTDLYGDSVVWVSKNGIRADNLRTGATMIVAKPYETLTLCNTQSKMIFQCPLKDFRCPIAKTFAIFTFYRVDDVPMQAGAYETILKLPAKRYVSTRAFAARQFRLQHTDGIPATNPQKVEVATTQSLQLPDLAAAALSRFYNIPIVPGVPLWARIQNLNMLDTVTLDTSKVTKEKIDAAKFVAPSGYKIMKEASVVIRSKMSPESMQLFGEK